MTQVVYFRGKPACQHQVDAQLDFEHIIGRKLTVYQMIGSAPESAGTHGNYSGGRWHGGGCTDVPSLSNAEILKGRIMGLWWSNRFIWQGFSMAHCHGVVFGDPDLLPGAAYQETDLRRRGDGLVGSRPDLFPRPQVIVTYAGWKKATHALANAEGYVVTVGGQKRRAITEVSAKHVDNARRFHWYSTDLYWTQVQLRKRGLYPSPLDGKWGKVTAAGLAKFRKSLGWEPRTAVGVNLLTELFKVGKSSLHVVK